MNIINSEIENFRNLLNKYSDALVNSSNFFKIEEITISKEDAYENIIQMIGSEIKSLNKGKYSVVINEKFLIVFDSFKLKMKDYCKNFILTIRTYIKFLHDNKKEIINLLSENDLNNLVNLLNFTNFILIFSPEFYTVYNMKKEILFIIREIKKFEEVCLSEFMFINYVNGNNRKCSVGWDYRLFLIRTFGDRIAEVAYSYYKDKVDHLVKNIKTYAEIFDVELDKVNYLLLTDLSLILLINENDKRNYHLWKYIVLLFHFCKIKKENFLIFAFCLNCFLNDPLDYSAYSSVRTFYKILRTILSEENKVKLTKYINSLTKIYPDKLDNHYMINFCKEI